MMSHGDGARRLATVLTDLRGRNRNNVYTSEALLSLTSEGFPGHEVPTIASLPCGVLSHIFLDLGPRDLASASCVCTGWRRLVALEAAANQVWRSFYSARWHLSGAHWPSRPPHNTSSSGISASTSIAISVSRPITVTGSISSGGACASSTTRSGGSASSSSSSAVMPASLPEMRWQRAYGTKMLRLRSWSGRYSADQVTGHKMAVRAAKLLPACDLMATASLDRTVRLWDLASGMLLGHSRPHGGIVRCLALDTGVLASGSSDCLVRVWRPRAAETAVTTAAGATAAAAMPLFHISSKPHILRGHGGPVSCLALDESVAATEVYGSGEVYGGTLFSGSWDCTVRVWRQGGDGSDGSGDDGGVSSDGSGAPAVCSSGDERSTPTGPETPASAAEEVSGGRRCRLVGQEADAEDGGWSCAGVLQYSDWVHCCAVRAGNLLVAAGSEVVVTDATTGRAVRRFADLHDGGAVACLEGCRSGRLLFTASGDGLLLAHDLRMKQGSRVLWHHNAAVTGLAFEDPWLASSSADGCIMLQDSEQALSGGGSPQRALNAGCRALHCPAGQPALCLDLADQWLAAGTDSGVVRLWDFTGAAAAAERAAASRSSRSAARASKAAVRQQQHQHQQQQQHGQLPPDHQQQLQSQPQRQRRQRGSRHQHQQPLEQQQQQAPHLQELEAQGAQACDPLAGAWAAAGAAPLKWGGGSPSADAPPPPPPPAAQPPAAPSSSRRGGHGSGGVGGGSSDRWRHGHPQHSALASRARAPKPPPPMAPTFRYVSSGSGGVGAAGSGMTAIAGPSQQRTQRPQRP